MNEFEKGTWVSARWAANRYGLDVHAMLRTLNASTVRRLSVAGLRFPQWHRGDIEALMAESITTGPASPTTAAPRKTGRRSA